MSETHDKRKREEDSGNYSSGEDSGVQDSADGAAGASNLSPLEKLKREKRLAMNRESARARRRRKKLRLGSLEQRTEGLSQRQHALVLENQGLKARIVHLETELARARAMGGRGGGPSMLQQQAMMASRMGDASSARLPFGMMGPGMGGDSELQYLQRQMMSGNAGGAGGGAGLGSERAARFAAMQDLQSQMQISYPASASPGGSRGGQLSDIERLNMMELSRIRGAELNRSGGGHSLMDFAALGGGMGSPGGTRRASGGQDKKTSDGHDSYLTGGAAGKADFDNR